MYKTVNNAYRSVAVVKEYIMTKEKAKKKTSNGPKQEDADKRQVRVFEPWIGCSFMQLSDTWSVLREEYIKSEYSTKWMKYFPVRTIRKSCKTELIRAICHDGRTRQSESWAAGSNRWPKVPRCGHFLLVPRIPGAPIHTVPPCVACCGRWPAA